MTPIKFKCEYCGQPLEASSEASLEIFACPNCQEAIRVPECPKADRVFISYAAADQAVAEQVLDSIESEGFRCWIAPRDITPGMEWSAAILDGIDQSVLMVVVCSAETNQSQHVIRELERAVNRGLVIIPFRIVDVPLSRSMEYFLSNAHWLNAYTQPLDAHLGTLRKTVTKLLTVEAVAGPSNGLTAPRSFASGPLRRRSPLLIGVFVTVLALIIAGAFFFLGDQFPPESPAAVSGDEVTSTAPKSDEPSPAIDPSKTVASVPVPPGPTGVGQEAPVKETSNPTISEPAEPGGKTVGPWRVEVDSFELAESFGGGAAVLEPGADEKIAVLGLTLTVEREYTEPEISHLQVTDLGNAALEKLELLETGPFLSEAQFFLGHFGGNLV